MYFCEFDLIHMTTTLSNHAYAQQWYTEMHASITLNEEQI